MPESPDVVAETVKALGAGPAAHEAYKDLLQPAAREIGQDLLTVAHVVHRAMAPLRGAVWCYDQISEIADHSSSYLDNLLRLQILEIDSSKEMMTDEDLHAEIPYDVKLTEIRELLLTDFGTAFLKICVEGPAGAADAKLDRDGIGV